MIPLLILTPMILLAALGAVWKARPVHAALLLALALALVAVLYLTQAAEFIGLVQFMVYVGGVAILIVFALLITRPGDETAELVRRPRSLAMGLACVIPVLGMLLYAYSKGLPVQEQAEPPPAPLMRAVGIGPYQNCAKRVDRTPSLPVEAVGKELFENSVPAVLAMGVLLTAVLIGAALFARDPAKKPEPPVGS